MTPPPRSQVGDVRHCTPGRTDKPSPGGRIRVPSPDRDSYHVDVLNIDAHRMREGYELLQESLKKAEAVEEQSHELRRHNAQLLAVARDQQQQVVELQQSIDGHVDEIRTMSERTLRQQADTDAQQAAVEARAAEAEREAAQFQSVWEATRAELATSRRDAAALQLELNHAQADVARLSAQEQRLAGLEATVETEAVQLVRHI